MQCAMTAVYSTNKVYSQLQTLISTFQSIIVPGALNHVVSEDAIMLQLMDAIKNIRVTSEPGVAVRIVLDNLNEDYQQAAVKVCVWLHLSYCYLFVCQLSCKVFVYIIQALPSSLQSVEVSATSQRALEEIELQFNALLASDNAAG